MIRKYLYRQAVAGLAKSWIHGHLSQGNESEETDETDEEEEPYHPTQPGFLDVVRIVFFSCLGGDRLAHAKQVAPKST